LRGLGELRCAAARSVRQRTDATAHPEHLRTDLGESAKTAKVLQSLKILYSQELTMKVTAVVSAILAASMLIGSLAIAQGGAPYNNRARTDQGQREDMRDRADYNQRPSNRGNDGNYGRGNDRNNWRGNDQQQRFDRGERGAGPDHAYYRGERMPLQYRSRQYVVEDWRSHRLSAPPRGYHWVQSGGDYVLVAIATGIILQLLLNN
jgi:Ni/Co efflux regulator RcnB